MRALRFLFTKYGLNIFSVGQVRSITYPTWWYDVRTTMKRRLEKLEKDGPRPPKPRSIWPNWNYRAELFAFGKRLNEELPEAVLQRTFIQQSYVEKEQVAREELGVPQESMELTLDDNSALVAEGKKVISDSIQKYLHLAFPALPEEGKSKIQDYLMTEDLIANIASHLGMSDLILSVEFPPSRATLASTFLAFVGALNEYGSSQRAEKFAQDFIIPELIGKDVLEIWEIPNPVAYLKNLFAGSDKELEYRLLRTAGRNTIFAVYCVGIYVDKTFIGQGPGETISVAEEMASLDALKRIFGLTEHADPLPVM